MKKKLTALLLSLALVLTMAPVGVFAGDKEAAGQADILKVEADYDGGTSVKLVWNWDSDSEKLPEGFVDPKGKAVFNIYDGDEVLLKKDLVAATEENKDGYSYEEGKYEYELVYEEELTPGEDYKIEIRAEDSDEEVASGYVTFSTKEEDAIEESEEDLVESEPEASASLLRGEPAGDNAEPKSAEQMESLRAEGLTITVEHGVITDSTAELNWKINGGEVESPEFTVKNGEEVVAETVTGTTYTVTELTESTAYTFTVELKSGEAAPGSISFTTVAKQREKVSNFKATAVGNSKDTNYLQLSWSPVSGAASYEIRWSGDNFASPIKTVTAPSNSYKHKITSAGKKYTFRIKALDGQGKPLSADTDCKGTVPNITIKKSSGTATTLKLTVSIPSGNKGSYRIVITDANKKSKKLPVIKNAGKKQAESRVAKKLTAARTYKCYVYNSNGVVSQTITVKTALANVKGFKAQSSAGKVYLSWKKVPRAKEYVITRTGGGSKKKTWTTKKRSFVDNTVDQGYTARTYTYKIKAKREGFPKSRKAASTKGDAVRTMLITITFGTTRTLTDHTDGKTTTTFNRGYTTTAVGFDAGKYHFYYKGKLYYVIRESISSASVSQLNTGRTYSAAEATKFVNDMHLSSATSHLIWVNTYTQKEYIFTGSKDHWKLVQGPWIVATGKASTPTSTGMTSIKTRSAESGVPWWNITSWFSLHGNHPSWGDLGYPKSGACVRNTNEHASWIYHNTALGTAVYVF